MPNNRGPRLSGETPQVWRKSARRDFSQRLLPRGHAEVSDTDQCELSGKGSRLCENVRKQRKRRIVFSFCFFRGLQSALSFS